MGIHSALSAHLPDIQTTPDTREIFIEEVGVSDIRIPVSVLEKPNHLEGITQSSIQRTVGTVSMHVSLNQEVKGTHMSRFTELLNKHTANQKTFSSSDLLPLAEEMLTVLETQHSRIRVEMDFFRDVEAPASKIRGVAPYHAILEVHAYQVPLEHASQLDLEDDSRRVEFQVFTEVEIIGQTCCPCSKEISDFDHETGKGRGAHSQHGHVHIRVENDPSTIIWFEDLIDLANRALSCPSYPILKRVDEKAATIGAYENPCFVEDVLRNCAVQLQDLPGTYHYQVWVKNDEVIHFHTATGMVSGDSTLLEEPQQG
jgi:GTP cyclohydrolase I